ncbi:MAG: Rrf2 family transcriptional regulator [bacterium]|nr:Rrf2 family transcriptional regulator [bacterium]
MIYSRSAEYAIRAFVYLADVPEGKYAMVKNIATESEIPTHFLAKILQQLARKGFLRSSKGPTGGFILHRPADDITLLELVDAIDGLSEYQRCPSGMSECNDEAQCGMHESWKELRSRIMGYLEDTTIADVAEALHKKRESLAKPAPKKRRSSKKK